MRIENDVVTSDKLVEVLPEPFVGEHAQKVLLKVKNFGGNKRWFMININNSCIFQLVKGEISNDIPVI